MVRLCLFDLDQTLVATNDIEELRLAGVTRTDAAYRVEVQRAFNAIDRRIVDEAFLVELLRQVPEMKLGILTRSPRRYVDTVLQQAFPSIQWASVVAYEDVAQRKPHCEGVYKAMENVGMYDASDLPDVLLIGDSDVDIRAAYHAGCPAVLFTQGWPQQWGEYTRSHWRSMNLLPDAIAASTDDLLAAIIDPVEKLPDLECLLVDARQAPRRPRFDQIGKFFPDDRKRHVVHTAGRSFARYQTLERRRAWHLLSQSIEAHKDAVQFPNEWIMSIQRFISVHFEPSPLSQALAELRAKLQKHDIQDEELVITCIPARPGRIHRLGHLVSQLAVAYGSMPRIGKLLLKFDSEVMAYRPGVRSQSREYLNREERFTNVRDHLHVVNPVAARGRKFIVIDDVTTTGATLLYAKQYLTQAGAASVDCFSLAQDISDPLRQL